MNNKFIADTNILSKIYKMINSNLKIIISTLILIFIIFLSYQGYSYYALTKIQKNSITYFNGLNLKDDNKFYELMVELSNSNDFYSILSKLELINLNINKENYDKALELYEIILKNNKIENIYKTAIASKAAYNFINIQYNHPSLEFIPKIKELISYIDESLTSYIGIKLELEYLLIVTEQDLNDVDYKSSNEIIDLHKLIIESENISSKIKERVNKIHEYQLYN